jgi:hypothetical protein
MSLCDCGCPTLADIERFRGERELAVKIAAEMTAKYIEALAELDAAMAELAAFKSKDTRPTCFNCGAPCESCAQLKELKGRLSEGPPAINRGIKA